MSIDAGLLKEAIAYAKAVRQTELACACGSVSDNFVRVSEEPDEAGLNAIIKELEIETNDRIPTHNAFEQSTTGSVRSV